MAGIAGVQDIGPESFRTLAWKAEGKREHDWILFSCLIAKVHNVNCVEKKDLKSPDEMNPMKMARRKAPTAKQKMKAMAASFGVETPEGYG